MRFLAATAGLLALALSLGAASAPEGELARRNDELIEKTAATHRLDPEQVRRVHEIFDAAPWMGQGNPAISTPAMSAEECRERWQAAETGVDAAGWEEICGRPLMAPLYDPATEGPEDARACIDRLEFPGLPCERPVVWVRAREAAELCRAVGKRLCDAHEWEGACAGRLEPPDYRFDLAAGRSAGDAVAAMRKAHNAAEAADRSWAYGEGPRDGVCAAASFKHAACEGGQWATCGSNTYPAGSFPTCRSPLGVDDLHGNAAEHMNLPLAPDQMASTGSRELGVTEMKGSWFIWDRFRAHEDWCRWRAPFWHGSRVMAADSHHNYHLGFRCCLSVEATGPTGPEPPRTTTRPRPGAEPAPPGSGPRR